MQTKKNARIAAKKPSLNDFLRRAHSGEPNTWLHKCTKCGDQKVRELRYIDNTVLDWPWSRFSGMLFHERERRSQTTFLYRADDDQYWDKPGRVMSDLTNSCVKCTKAAAGKMTHTRQKLVYDDSAPDFVRDGRSYGSLKGFLKNVCNLVEAEKTASNATDNS